MCLIFKATFAFRWIRHWPLPRVTAMSLDKIVSGNCPTGEMNSGVVSDTIPPPEVYRRKQDIEGGRK